MMLHAGPSFCCSLFALFHSILYPSSIYEDQKVAFFPRECIFEYVGFRMFFIPQLKEPVLSVFWAKPPKKKKTTSSVLTKRLVM